MFCNWCVYKVIDLNDTITFCTYVCYKSGNHVSKLLWLLLANYLQDKVNKINCNRKNTEMKHGYFWQHD